MSKDKHLEKAAKSIHDSVEDVRDATKETLHRSTAEAERIRRELTAAEMTPREKVASVANEAKNRVQAEIDKAKRKAR